MYMHAHKRTHTHTHTRTHTHTHTHTHTLHTQGHVCMADLSAVQCTVSMFQIVSRWLTSSLTQSISIAKFQLNNSHM